MKVLVATACAALFATGAHAGEGALFDWSGAYVGLNAGGAFGSVGNRSFVRTLGSRGYDTDVNGPLDLTSSGFIGGVQAGYNWQLGRIVYGVEADIQGASISNDGPLSYRIDFGIGYDIKGEPKTKIDWFGTVRARLGYVPSDRIMIYGTGGLAYGRAKNNFNADLYGGSLYWGSTNKASSATKAGWTVGVGAEYALASNWTIKGEYLYVDLGKATFYQGNLFGSDARIKSDISFHVVRLGVNYKF